MPARSNLIVDAKVFLTLELTDCFFAIELVYVGKGHFTAKTILNYFQSITHRISQC